MITTKIYLHVIYQFSDCLFLLEPNEFSINLSRKPINERKCINKLNYHA